MTALGALMRRDIRIALRVGGGALIGVLFFLTVVVLMLDRPVAFIGGLPAHYDLGYGIFVALGGSVILAVAGLLIRRRELLLERGRRLSRREAAARGPNAASPPRSPR